MGVAPCFYHPISNKRPHIILTPSSTIKRVSTTPKYGFRKAERLRGGAADALFRDSKSGFAFPYRFVWKSRPMTENDEAEVSVLVAVPKRNIKRAVGRNLLKRRTREAYRLGKHPLIEAARQKGLHVDVGLIYSTKEVVDYRIVSRGVETVLAKISRGL